MSSRFIGHVSPEQIQFLTDLQLRDVMQSLLWAEAVRCSADRSQICINQELKASDDGSDGESPAHSGPPDWMPSTRTCWQLKAGSAGEPAKLVGEVKKRIPRATLMGGGAYVIVASHASGTKQVAGRLAVLCEEAEAEALPTDKIRVYGCENIANWVNQFPAVAARLVGLQEGLLLFGDWTRQEQFTGKYHASDEILSQIDTVQRTMTFAPGGTRHVHVVGPPGVGKTRLALEIGRAFHLAPLLIYFDSFRAGIIDNLAGVRSQPDTRLLAVVDEVLPDGIRQLQEQVRVADGRLILITIGSAPPFESTGVMVLELKPLSRNEMNLVIKDYAPHLPNEHVDFAVRFADGYVKLARLVCDSLSHEPDIKALEMLQQAGDMTRLLDRLLGDLPRQDRRCLFVLALLDQVGWSHERENEGQAVAKHLELDWLDVKQMVIEIHKKSGIAPSAGRLRYISPRPLALYLAISAMEIYGDRLRGLPDKLPNDAAREAFYHRLGELADFPAARRQCREELDRFFSLDDFQEANKTKIWSHMALTDPPYAAAQLRRILEAATHEKKLVFVEGRRELVWTLEKLAWPKASFRDAMLGLAELAVAENENIGNNATADFINRYQVVLGGTVVPYLERLSVLDELLKRTDVAYHKLVVRALGMIGRFHETRMCGGENHGMQNVEEEWHPATWEEDSEARREALCRLTTLAIQGHLSLENDLVSVAEAFIGPLVHANFVSELAEFYITLARRFPKRRELLRSEVAELIDHWMGTTGNSPHPQFDDLCKLHSALVDPSFEGRLLQYVGRPRWKDRDDSLQLDQLVDEVLATPAILSRHIPWLTSGQAGNGWAFGEALGKRDIESLLWPTIVNREERGGDLLFVSAYLVGQSTLRPSGWFDEWLDRKLAEPNSDDALVLDATWRSTPSDRGVRRFIDSVRSGRLPETAYWCLGYGRWPIAISVEIFQDLVSALAEQPVLRTLALRLLTTRMHHMPADLVHLESIATELVLDPELVRHKQGHMWTAIATRLVESKSQQIVRTLFAAHNLRGHWFLQHSHAATVLGLCVSHDPKGAWDELRPILENRADSAFFITGFPQGIVERLPRSELLQWATLAVPDRPCLLARLATPDHANDNSLIAQIANSYADDTDVCSAVFAAVMSGMHAGSSAEHWARKALSLRETANKTSLPGLRRWAVQAASWFTDMAERDRVREEENKLLLS